MDANARPVRGRRAALARLGRTGRKLKKNDALRLTIAVITLVLLATLIGVAPAILTALYQHW